MLVARTNAWARYLAVALCIYLALAANSRPADAAGRHPTRRVIDHSGQVQKGRASYYGRRFTNHRMANGRRFDPKSHSAASRTLPLGTTAKVTNLENGRSATVKIVDRGPFAPGRVVDVSPLVADELQLKKHGVAPVVVAPIAVPQANGTLLLGAGAKVASPKEIKEAEQETRAAIR